MLNFKMKSYLIVLVIAFISVNFIESQKSKSKVFEDKSKKSKEIKKEIPFVQKLFVKTLGQIGFEVKRGRIPAKGIVVECVVKCSATYGCHCVRVNKKTNECNTFISSKDDPNSERNETILENYIYYTKNGNQSDIGNGVNIAINKRVTQSSTYNQFKAQKAFDNNKNTESKTSGGKIRNKSSLPWLQIDFKEEYVITGVLLLTTDKESFHDFEIRVGSRQISRTERNSHFRDNPICFGFIGNNFLENNKPKVVKCEPCPLMGKYLTIQIVKNCTLCSKPGDNALNLAEVEVYGYLP